MKPSAQLQRNLEDVDTEVLIQTFADRILVVITQVGKVGSLIQASIPATAGLLLSSNASHEEVASEVHEWLPSPPPSIQLTPLLGSAPTEHVHILHSLFTSHAATLVWLSLKSRGEENKPVVVGIALKKADTWDEMKERKIFMGAMEMLRDLLATD